MNYQTTQPITQQPSDGLKNCPPGLEYLASINQLLVKQCPEVFEAITGFETSNKYAVLNTMGQPIYNAVEVNNFCCLNCCGNYRCFDMKVLDNHAMEVMHFERPLRCSANCIPFCCCGQEILAYSPPGNFIGKVVQKISCCGPRFNVEDENGQPQLRLQGPCCVFDCCFNVEFKLFPIESDTQIGVVTKQWSGLVKEAFTDADNFGISFPADLEVRMKALLLAQLILIDYMYFENNQDK